MKDELTSKTNSREKPMVPTIALALLKTLLRGMTVDITMPAITDSRNPRKVPGVWLCPTASMASPAAANTDRWA